MVIDRRPLKLFQTFARGKLVKPFYKDYSFANIIPTIFYLLTGEKYAPLLNVSLFGGRYPRPKKVVLILLDGFGFFDWEELRRKVRPLARISRQGRVSPLCALFPSTTAAAITSLNYGVLPPVHALFEWFLYLREYSRVIQTLPFASLGDKSYQDDLLDRGLKSQQMISVRETIYEKLARNRVPSFVFVPKAYSHSAYNQIAQKGSDLQPFTTLAEGLTNLKKALGVTEKKSYFYLYWGKVDSVRHHYGPGTLHDEAEVAAFWLTFDYVFSDFDQGETLFLFASDHGQIKSNPKEAYYLNLEIPQIVDFLRRDKKGWPIYPTGSPRDVYLHVKRGKVEALASLLKEQLKDKAHVMLVKEALSFGLFGPPPYSRKFLERLGRLLILPYAGETVWWYEKDVLEVDLIGHHGGLSREEMTIPLMVF